MKEQRTSYKAGLGNYASKVEAALDDIQNRDLVKRIWAKDHTVWRPDPTEITNRLGWLTVTDTMREQVAGLEAFAQEIRDTGFQHVVLLGMGGSSLGPEVLRQTIGPIPGYPRLIVLDSTLPSWIQSVADSIDPKRTLFLVSSKSGGTLETLSFYRYFRGLVEERASSGEAGQNFVAITDPGTSLDELAQEQGFRDTFLNPEDIGGRYSVLSFFGLVPAALTGVDIGKLMDRANLIRKQCGPNASAKENPGVWLGVVMGVLALEGRDKLTLVTSPAIESFGLWVEQLLAESIGKEGKGIISIAGEPLVAPEHYGEDRLFVFLRLDGDDNAAVDRAMDTIASSGHPWVRLDMGDRYDLGAEFYRWEFATSVAGAILDVHPFDQPNVQQAKDMTDMVLKERRVIGSLPQEEAGSSLPKLLAGAAQGNYVAIMAYLCQTPETDQALAQLRRRIMEHYHIPVTLGYGPRFLHSTGQMHKGGPDTGLFLQITTTHSHDLDIPGENFSFGVLAQAQALGDLKTLQAIKRRVVRIHLDSVDQGSLDELAGTPI